MSTKPKPSKSTQASKAPADARVVATHFGHVLGLSIAKDGRIVGTAMGRTGRGQVHMWNPESGQLVCEFGNGEGQVCWYAEPSPDGDSIAAGFGDCILRLHTVSTGQTRELARLSGIVASLGFSADGRYLFTGDCTENMVRLWDVRSGEVVAAGKTKKSGGWKVALSPDGTRGVSGAADKLVHVWDTHAGKEVGALEGHTGRILELAFHPSGRSVLSASQDKTARIWDLETGASTAVLEGHRKQVLGARFSPDGRACATLTSEAVRVFDTTSGELMNTLRLGDRLGVSLAYAVDGSAVLVGCEKGEVVRIEL